MSEYNSSNPHPEFGKNPNIMNVAGHTLYPKFVTDTQGKRVIVNSPKEEMEATGAKTAASKAAEKPWK